MDEHRDEVERPIVPDAEGLTHLHHLDGPGPGGPVTVVTGHYGSGKTEFAVSLAFKRAAEGKLVAIADLDIVNPYFRSRERADEMEQHGIRIYSSSLGHKQAVDLPAVSAEIRGPIQDPNSTVILDVGGDSIGAKVIVGFNPDLRRRGYEMLLVVNAYRAETQTLDGVLRHLASIQSTSTLEFTGLISNTHVIRHTTAADVLVGYELTKAVSEASGLPIRYISAIPSALQGLPDDLEGERLPIGLYMRDAWM